MLKTRLHFVGLVVALLAMMALAATALTAQEGAVRPINPQARPVTDAYPQGDVFDASPTFIILYEPGLPANVTWLNVEVMDGNTSVMSEWFEVAVVCREFETFAECYGITDTVVHPGLGDKDLTWTLSEYNSSTEAITEIDTYDFTVKAANPVAPTTFGDLTGSPMFEMETPIDVIQPPDQYRLYIIEDDTNTTVVDEWVFVADSECIDPTCSFLLEPPQAPLYNDGDYTLYAQGFTFPDSLSSWSEPFSFTVDYTEAPEVPSVILENIASQIDVVDFFGVGALGGTPCDVDGGMTETYTCPTSDPALLFFVEDHGDLLMEVAPEPGDGRLASEAVDGADLDNFPIYDATQWFNVTVTGDSEGEVYNAWINTYADSRCVSVFGLGARTVTMDAQRGEPYPGGYCIIELSGLASDDYTVEWQTYNPGGLPTASADMTVVTAPPPLDVEDVETPQMSEIELAASDVLVNLYWTDPGFIPQWIHYIVRDTADNSVVVDEWMEITSYLQFQLLIYEYYDEFGPEGTSELDILLGRTICLFSDCVAFPDWNLTNGDYEVTIQTWAGDEVSSESDPIAFTLDNMAPSVLEGDLDVVRMFDVAGNTSPTYSWIADNNASWHNLQVEDSEGELLVDDWFRWGSQNRCEVDEMSGEVACEYQPDSILTPGDYTWRVRAYGSGGLGDFSTDQTLDISNATLTVPVPITPVAAGDPHSAIPVFTWTPSDNGSWYQIVVTDLDDNLAVIDEWVYVPLYTCDPMGANTCVYSFGPEGELLSGDFSWRIRGATGSAISNWSSSETFEVESTNTGVDLIYPGEEFVDGDITFYWEPGESNQWYNLILWEFNPYLDGIIEGRDDLPEPVFSMWMNQMTLGNGCDIPDWLFLRTVSAEATRAEIPLPPFYCEFTIDDADLDDGYYIWTVDSWGPAYGAEILESSEYAPIIKR